MMLGCILFISDLMILVRGHLMRPSRRFVCFKIFPPFAIGTDSLMKFIKMATLTCTYAAVIPMGSSYSFSHMIPHRVMKLPNMATSTLILQGPTQKVYSDVFVETPLQQEQRNITKFTVDQLRANFLRYQEILKKQV
jgi:hypothetical protein